MPDLTLHLPFPPSVNHYWRTAVRQGKASPYVSAQGKAYRKAVKRALGKERMAGRLAEPLRSRLAVTVGLFAPTGARYDIDNRMKGLLDALTDAEVWEDDSQVDRLVIERGEVIEGGGCVVVIRTRAGETTP
ncbi:crossover junction endodeoxyribonuclease RusA [Dokdonella fugitiva]|uniref:Crossover junction endodeoxyribonuclease rusA n=1 Tax=Dokdonella fugitiva TaxID=328517 RepID=A0A839F1E2_9GAMM|nr:RusA family crossover junction endodeoxyribonuclease [Dokdonella fugitiva]MBA8886134.1 crossover junction endodeoxyribonuclease RusA [Dokdonella fugitiva]